MWWVGSKPTHVYLGETACAIALAGQEPLWSEQASVLRGLEWAGEMVKAGLSGTTPTGVHVWLSGSLARPFLLPPVPGLKHEGEARAIAASMVEESTGLAGACEVHLDRWTGNGTTLATAISAELQGLLNGPASPLGRARAIRPWWTAVVNAVIAEDPAAQLVAVGETGSTTVLGGDGQSLTVAQSFGATERDDMQSMLARLAVSSSLEGQRWLVRTCESMPTDAQTSSAVLGRLPFRTFAERCA